MSCPLGQIKNHHYHIVIFSSVQLKFQFQLQAMVLHVTNQSIESPVLNQTRDEHDVVAR